MGGLPSRESSGSIRTLRYGNHEIGLIPLTRQFFNKENPELCEQFIRVRNDPNVRYCHMRKAGYCMDELPPAEYSQEDLDSLVNTVEESLFDTNEDFLNAGASPIAPFSVSEMQRVLQMEGIIDAFDPQLDPQALKEESVSCKQLFDVTARTHNAENSTNNGETSMASHLYAASASHESESDSASQGNPAAAQSEANSNDNNNRSQPATPSSAAAGAVAASTSMPSPPELLVTNANDEEITAPSPARRVEATFRSLKAELQAYYREAEKNDAVGQTARVTELPDLFQAMMYRRFKRAVRPLTCAVVFIYVNSREVHDCFAFRGHRINVIGCFGLRTYEDESDDTIPVLQIRKGIVKAAGDRTLERVLALAAKSFVDGFTEIVLRELQRRSASALLKGVGEEARRLLRELPTQQQQQLPNTVSTLSSTSDHVTAQEPLYDPVSVANALFFERMSKYPMLCVGLFNNYPTLKFIFDFSALAISVEEVRGHCNEQMRLCTYQREKDERGLAFLFPGRLLAYTWLWSATQTQPPTVRDNWVQYTLNDYAQSRERRVQQWLETSPTAKVMLGNAITTRLFLEHLDNLHSEIVRARTTPTEDSTSWAKAQEYSYDSKLYRIFISPICGPLLTTVKEQKNSETAKMAGHLKKSQQQRVRSPPAKMNLSSNAARGNVAEKIDSDVCGERVEKETTATQLRMSGVPSQTGLGTLKSSTTTSSVTAAPTAQTTGTNSGAAPPYPHQPKPGSVHVGARDDRVSAHVATAAATTGPQPPSYAALARGAYPIPSLHPYTSPQQQQQQQQALQQMYLTGNCIAVPTTPSGVPWVVPQFLPQPPPSPSLSSVMAPGSSPVQLPPPPPPPSPPMLPSQQQQQQQQQQQIAPSTTSSNKATHATYILQIGSDGKQTLLPIALASNAQMNGSQSLTSPYQLQSLSPPNLISTGYTPLNGFPSLHQNTHQQQQLIPLTATVTGAGAVKENAGVYYAPATSCTPASYITPLQTPQPVYPAVLPTVTMPYSLFQQQQQQQQQPQPSPGSSSVNVTTTTPISLPQTAAAATAVQHHMVQLLPPPQPPSYAPRGSQTDLYTAMSPTPPSVTTPFVNRHKAITLPQTRRGSNVTEEVELFENALRLLD